MSDFYRRRRRRVCQMCIGKDVDYKDLDVIRRYVSAENGKILPRRITGACAKHQRYIAKEVKKARHMALIPFVK